MSEGLSAMPKGPSTRVAQWAEKLAFNATGATFNAKSATFNATSATFNATSATFNATNYGLWVWTKAIINHKQQPPKRDYASDGLKRKLLSKRHFVIGNVETTNTNRMEGKDHCQ